MIVATHNGSFHADELIGCMILSFIEPNLSIIRSRDPEVLNEADYIIDVGGKYDLEKNFDHHPSEFTLARENQIKFASAGLVWKKFGKNVLEILAKQQQLLPNNTLSEQALIIEKSHKYIDKSVMSYLDLVDNGQLDSYLLDISKGATTPERLETFFAVNEFYNNTPSLPYLIAMQNVTEGTESQQYQVFIETMVTLKVLFRNLFIKTISQARDEEVVLKLYDGSEILRLDRRLPWISAVQHNFEVFNNCKIVIYPDTKQGYRIQSLPQNKASRFINRAPAPKAWWGKEGEELNKLAGITSATFVHKSGFTGGALTKADIDTMARNWLKQAQELN